jgi:hypothetical protein
LQRTKRERERENLNIDGVESKLENNSEGREQKRSLGEIFPRSERGEK